MLDFICPSCSSYTWNRLHWWIDECWELDCRRFFTVRENNLINVLSIYGDSSVTGGGQNSGGSLYLIYIISFIISCGGSYRIGDRNPVDTKLIMLYSIFHRLDLDKWINEPLSESSSEEEPTTSIFAINHDDSKYVFQLWNTIQHQDLCQ